MRLFRFDNIELANVDINWDLEEGDEALINKLNSQAQRDAMNQYAVNINEETEGARETGR